MDPDGPGILGHHRRAGRPGPGVRGRAGDDPPTGVKLCANGSADCHLSGRVTDAAFRGRGYEHVIDVNGSTRLTGAFADVKAPRGDTIGLRMDPAGCHLFPVADEQ